MCGQQKRDFVATGDSEQIKQREILDAIWHRLDGGRWHELRITYRSATWHRHNARQQRASYCWGLPSLTIGARSSGPLSTGRVSFAMIGTSVSHYRIISHIGAGGMGTVYLAEDTKLKRRVALKFLSPGTVRESEAAARLLREARAASALDHPHIATIYEIGDHAGQPFIAMAHYEGETLAARLAHGQMPLGEIARILTQVADALDAAHTAGIVHRDLKPSNLILTTTGHVKVLDFGLAKIETGETATQLTAAGSTVGTAAYMSPEQAAGESVDARSDLWSLGVVTYEMLAGRRPFDGTSALGIIHAVLTTTPPGVKTLRPDVPPELEAIVHRTLVRECERRTVTAAVVRDLAATCHARLSSGGSAAVARTRAPRRRWIAAAGLAFAVAVSGVAWRMERNAKIRWAQHQALPEVIKLSGADQFDEAYGLAQQAQRYIPDDPLLAEQLRTISRRATIVTNPPGAEVFYRPYRPFRRALAAAREGPSTDAPPLWRAALQSRDGRVPDGRGCRALAVRRRGTHPLAADRCRPGTGWHGSHSISRSDVGSAVSRPGSPA